MLFQHLDDRQSPLDGRSIGPDPTVVIVGAKGDWATIAIRPDLAELVAALERKSNADGRTHKLSVVLLDRGPEEPENRQPFEQYINVDEPRALERFDRGPTDVVIIAIPDSEHGREIRKWMNFASPPTVILVEKPFTASSAEARKILSEVEAAANRVPLVVPYDHYLTYLCRQLSAPNSGSGPEMLDSDAEFDLRLTEPGPIEVDRLLTLASGLTFDLASHLLAVLSVLVGLDKVTDLQVFGRGRHSFEAPENLEGELYFAETWSQTSFKIEDAPKKGNTVTATLTIGKGIGKRPVKALRVKTASSEVEIPLVKDPTRLGRYAAVIQDLMNGGGDTIRFLLSIEEAVTIVAVLEQLRLKLLDFPEHKFGTVPFPRSAADWA